VAALHQDLLGRALRADEQQFWVDRIAAGMPRIEVAITLARSPEWTRVVVADLYRAILGRDPDAGGLEHWSGRLRNGERVAGLAGMIYGSPEYYANAGGTPEGWVRALYRSVLLREPDAAGTAFWASQVRGGAPLAQLAQGIYLSLESNARRVDALYAALLGRGTDPAGRDYWAQYLVDQDDIVLASQLVASDEYHARAQGR
jgi:hypothetical protein